MGSTHEDDDRRRTGWAWGSPPEKTERSDSVTRATTDSTPARLVGSARHYGSRTGWAGDESQRMAASTPASRILPGGLRQLLAYGAAGGAGWRDSYKLLWKQCLYRETCGLIAVRGDLTGSRGSTSNVVHDLPWLQPREVMNAARGVGGSLSHSPSCCASLVSSPASRPAPHQPLLPLCSVRRNEGALAEQVGGRHAENHIPLLPVCLSTEWSPRAQERFGRLHPKP